METKKEIVAEPKTAVASRTPSDLIALAMSEKADLEKLSALLTLQERWEANEAKKEYHRAMSAFKSEEVVVTKDKTNKQYSSKYCSLQNLINTVTPVLSKYGLSASWDILQEGLIKVTCKITHVNGHSECASMSSEPDTSGAKNKIQQIKSTITYLKSVTFESVCGLAATDANLSDDGNGSSGTPAEQMATEEELFKLTEWINSTGSNEKKLFDILKVKSKNELTKSKYEQAMTMLKAKDEAKKKKDAESKKAEGK